MRAYSATIIFIIICVLLTKSSLGTLSPKTKPKSKELKTISGPQDNDVFDLDLVQAEPLAKDILINHEAYFKDTARRRFNGTTLGFITPWNSHGYDVAKIFAKKLDIISPVWLQVIKSGDVYTLAGTHDVDTQWLADVKRKGKIMPQQTTVKVYPRIIFERFTDRDVKLLLTMPEERTKVNDLLIKACKDYGFDGISLEVWSQLAGRIDDQFLYTLVLQMSKELQKQQLRVILVIPPYRNEMPTLFGENHMDMLYKHVFAFALMTYDYSNVQRPGANAPLYWVRRAIELIVPDGCQDMTAKRAKILMGLNMYGNDYTSDGGGPIIFSKFLELVKHVKKQLVYDEHDVENFFEIKTNTGRHTVFYPTLYSINERIKLAQELGTGISMWELGQGLNYFYDLF